MSLLVFADIATAGDDDDGRRPAVYPAEASTVGSTTAVLRAWVNVRDQDDGRYRFEYGTTGAYGSVSPTVALPESDEWVRVSFEATGLQPGVTYQFRVVAFNEDGGTAGANRSFTTVAPTLPAPGPGPTPGPTAQPDGSPPAPQEPVAPDAAPAKPQLGSSVGVEQAAGTVLVRRRGTRRFVPLSNEAVIPVGSVLDASDGAVRLSATLRSGETQTGRFGGGRFEVAQRRGGLVGLHLRGAFCSRPGSKPAAGNRVTAQAAGPQRSPRRLWGRDRGGRFRTYGRNSHATVRGTRWLVEDRCAGTFTRVTEGSVLVRDSARGKHVVLRKGESYLARPRR